MERQGCNPPLPDQSHHRPAMDIISRKDALAQGLKHYFTGKPCKHGHVAPHFVTGACVECRIQKTAQYERNRKEALAKDSDRAERRRVQHNETTRKYHERFPEKRVAATNKWRQANPERARELNRQQLAKPEAKVRRKAWRAVQRETNYLYRVKNALRCRMHKAVKRQTNGKDGRTAELLGADWSVVMDHIAARFLPGMSWGNHGEWEIDHIRPCASFDLTDPAQQRECFHYSNLQPLWRFDNRSKNARLDWGPAAA